MPNPNGQTQAVTTRQPRRNYARAVTASKDVFYALTVSNAVPGSNWINFLTTNGTVPQGLRFTAFQRSVQVINLTSQVAYVNVYGGIASSASGAPNISVRSNESMQIALGDALPNPDLGTVIATNWQAGPSNVKDMSEIWNWTTQSAPQIGYLTVVLAANPAGNTSVIVVV